MAKFIKKSQELVLIMSFQIATHRSGKRISGALLATSIVTSIRLVIAACLTLGKVTDRVETLCMQ